MKALVTASIRCVVTPDGQVWTSNHSVDYSFWTRYLDVYDSVRLMVRTTPATKPPADWVRVTGPGIEGIPLPDFHGPGEFLKSYTTVRRKVGAAVECSTAVHLRAPCPVANLVWRSLSTGHPYGIEVIADPSDSFAPGAYKSPLRPVYRQWFIRRLRDQCRSASAAAYVTESALQRRYPPGLHAFVTNFSSVHLPPDAFEAPKRRTYSASDAQQLVTVGTLEQLYKGPNILLEAVARCVEEGWDLYLRVVGDGQYRLELEALAKRLGISDRTRFDGRVPAGEPIRSRLREADLFVLPSYQEGLPRATLEAMALGLPCIGSTVGGFVELLPEEDLVRPGDPAALARKIAQVLSDPSRRELMSRRNAEKAREYASEVLRERRIAFYRHVAQLTQDQVGLTP
ncbi:MAG: glycosyltransferase family 4 protein [Actinomycetota bacterium]|nr:glycosyltransferase family 4 protein [Actinomycetota bacterium]